jgi:regulator of replication initiation timing
LIYTFSVYLYKKAKSFCGKINNCFKKINFFEYLLEKRIKMSKSKISPNAIKKAIFNEGLRIKRKEELYDEVKRIEKELSNLNEASLGMAGSFGFVGDQSDNHKHGFVDDKFQNISNIARLEKEFANADSKDSINEDVIDENTQLKAEIEELKKKLEESKK